MFKLNLKIALRNLFINKIYAAINIGGLALGLTVFVIMLLYINFAYRIEMPVVPFQMATILSIVIAVLTVSIQARKTAVTDPVNALKYE